MRARDQADTVQLSKIRMKEPLRAALERDALARGVTMNAAIVERLDASFRDEESFGGRRTAALLRQLGAFVGLEGYNDDWLDDRAAFNVVMDRWQKHLVAIKPVEAETDRQENQRSLAEFRQILSTSDARGAKLLRSWAREYSENPRIDPEERAEWAALAVSTEE
jgi:hypothetical protein